MSSFKGAGEGESNSSTRVRIVCISAGFSVCVIAKPRLSKMEERDGRKVMLYLFCFLLSGDERGRSEKGYEVR